MDGINSLAFLSLIVALSAYMAGVRLAVLGRIQNKDISDGSKQQYKLFLKLLAPADICLVFAGVLMVLKMFWADLFNPTCQPHLDQPIVISFVLGIAILTLHHAVAWFKTYFSAG